jgi:hypothetical protein
MTKPPRDPEKVKQHAERRRRRLLYSLNDLQQALSACSFLYECDEQGTYSKPELRRFRCYETTLVVAYGRPFSQSLAGGIPPLSTKMIGLKLSPERRALHDRLIGMRNQIMAHSDGEMMRMTVKPFDVSLDDETRPVVFLQTVFDEGVTLMGGLLVETNELLHEIYAAIVRCLHHEAQQNPELFELRIDSEEARTARNIRV